ncbi:MAG: bifunctional 5,10-methylenetetrahydrofolate dehydrogenase/5,10-methenyltetrahydrofolate cyclohydrolase, partial [Bdellovibrio sp.]|nr:bifunctional 5,10-methylenetetrahydrofolate dehydrogenase/5,10-methenyltetrahydrofolate cyclohydrolase [Bdellovibrio sp.]
IHKKTPKLAVVLVGNNPASVIYTNKKGEMAKSLGIEHETVVLSENPSPKEVKNTIQKLNNDKSVDAVLIQRPLPRHFPEEDVLYWIDPRKDVDAFHPEQVGRLSLGLPCFKPCTPQGILELLHYYQFQPAYKLACVVGRSSIVGKPMAQLLLQENATVIQCHSKTLNLEAMTSQADLLIVAAGLKGLITADHVKKDAIVVDVGIHREGKRKISGDVCFDEVSKKALAITPVPGGVGPMTIMMLMRNTIQAAKLHI